MTIMKNYLLSMVMMLALAFATQGSTGIAAVHSVAQKHRHSATTTAVAPAATTTTAVTPATTQDTTGIEAFSDTTGLAEADSLNTQQHVSYQVSMSPNFDGILDGIDWNSVAGMFMVMGIVAIVCLLSPILIIAVIFYFVNKGRKDKLKLAQMALQNGQPIPEPLIRERPIPHRPNTYSGIKQMCLGIGLMIFLGLIIGKLGWGIGALVFFIGLGKLIIALIENNSRSSRNYTYTPRQTPPKVNNEEEVGRS